MKKLLAIALTAMLAVSLLAGCGQKSDAAANALEAIKQKGELVVATSPDYAPYEFEDLTKTGQDKYVGSDMELAKYIADKLGVKLTIKAMDFDTVLASIAEGKVDLAIAGLTYKEDRAKQMMLAGPFNSEGTQGVMIKKDSAIKSIADLKGLKVGAQNASMQQELVTTQAPEAVLELITSLKDGVMMLQTGKIDALAIASIPGQAFCDQYDDIVMSDIVFESENGLYIGITNGEQELYDEIMKIVAEINESGIYAEWLEDADALMKSLGIE